LNVKKARKEKKRSYDLSCIAQKKSFFKKINADIECLLITCIPEHLATQPNRELLINNIEDFDFVELPLVGLSKFDRAIIIQAVSSLERLPTRAELADLIEEAILNEKDWEQ